MYEQFSLTRTNTHTHWLFQPPPSIQSIPEEKPLPQTGATSTKTSAAKNISSFLSAAASQAPGKTEAARQPGSSANPAAADSSKPSKPPSSPAPTRPMPPVATAGKKTQQQQQQQQQQEEQKMEVETVGKKGQVKGRKSKFTVPTSKNNEQKEVHVAAPLQHVSTYTRMPCFRKGYA